MSYAHKVVRVSISGTAFQGAEIWSTGFFLGQEGSDAVSVTPPAVSKVNDHWKVFFEAANTHISWSYLTTQIKMAMIDTDGDTILDEVEYFNPSPAYDGGHNFNSWPAQISLAATLQSSNVRGLAAKGRMFLPGVNINLTAGGKADPTQLGQVSTALGTFLSSINTDVDIPYKVINASFGHKITPAIPGDPITYTPGQNKLVEWVKIGDVFDTQRRRRNALTETYTTTNVAD